MFTSLVLLFYSGDIKKKKSSENEKKKKSSENDQSTGHFQSFFFVPSTLNLKKNPVNQLIDNANASVIDLDPPLNHRLFLPFLNYLLD